MRSKVVESSLIAEKIIRGDKSLEKEYEEKLKVRYISDYIGK